MLVVVVSPHGVAHEDVPPELAVRGRLEEGVDAGPLEGEGPAAVVASAQGLPGRQLPQVGRQGAQVGLVGDVELVVVGLRQDVLAE